MINEYRVPRYLLGYYYVGASSTSQSYNNRDNSIISNSTCLLIVVAVLLLILVCALALRKISRCIVRYNARFPFEAAASAASRLGSKGLSVKELRKIPVMVYENAGVMKMVNVNECPICLGEYQQGEELRILPRCSHGFHVKCIDKWFLSHSSCPICRQQLLIKDGFRI